jgi:signal transduction histidine kinase
MSMINIESCEVKFTGMNKILYYHYLMTNYSNDILVYFLVYLLYGLAFFTLGLSIMSKDLSRSRLHLAKYMYLLAIFGFIHGVHEWVDLYLRLNGDKISLITPEIAYLIKLTTMWLSFFFLILFGAKTLAIGTKRPKLILYSILSVVLGLWVARFIVSSDLSGLELLSVMDLHTRHSLGLTGSLLAGIALIVRSQASAKYSKKGARSKMAAGVVLIIYGIFSGLIPSGTMFFEHLPVEAVRGICAIVLTIFLMRALHVFDMEKYEILEKNMSKLAYSEKLASMGKMAAGVAHEINNPLTNAMLNIEMLESDMTKNTCCEKNINRVKNIERNLERASKIASELLHFSQSQTVDQEPLDLHEVIDSSLLLLGNRVKMYTVAKEFGNIPLVMGIPWKLEEVIINILINAMDSMKGSGTITITTEENGKWIKAHFADTGAGISEESITRAFDPFYTTKEVGEGTGLGLSVSYGIMHMFGGDIKIRNSEKKGAVVTLYFPKGEENA